jgi:hypothetical protein
VSNLKPREGDWNAVCFECGRRFPASTLKKHWKGYWVCPTHWEPRQIQDFVSGVPDIQSPPWVQPPVDIWAPFCTPNGLSAVPNYSTPDCMVPDFLSPAFNPDGDPL